MLTITRNMSFLYSVMVILVFFSFVNAFEPSSSPRRLVDRGSKRFLDTSEEDVSSETSSNAPPNVQDTNFERRRRRKLNKGRQLKCKDEFEDPSQAKDYLFVNCVPTDTQNFETKFPTWSPTISPVPTITAFPSPIEKGNKPQNAPQKVPTSEPIALEPSYTPSYLAAPISNDEESEAACDAAQNGIVFKTNTSLQISFLYELLTNSSFALDSVVDTLEDNVGSYLAMELVPCDEDNIRRRTEQEQVLLTSSKSRTIRSSSSDGLFYQHRGLVLRGIGPSDRDVPSDDESCQVLVGNVTGTICYAMKGTIDVYVSERDGMTKDEASILVYELLKTTFNGNVSSVNDNARNRFLQQESLFVNESAGILGLYFLGANIQSDAGVSTAPEVPSANKQAVAESATDPSSSSLSGLGIASIIISCLIVIALALVMARRRSNRAKRTRGIELGDTETFDISPREGDGQKKSWDYGSGDGDENESLPGDVVSYDGSSVFHEIHADGGVHKQYVNGTGILQQGFEVTPTFVKSSNDNDAYMSPSSYEKRKKYQVTDIVDL